jgi:hypothetical protein
MMQVFQHNVSNGTRKQPYSIPSYDWGKGLLDVFLEISQYTEPCFVVTDGTIGSTSTSKYPGTRKNVSLGVGDWHFFPCAVFQQTLNIVICGFHFICRYCRDRSLLR